MSFDGYIGDAMQADLPTGEDIQLENGNFAQIRNDILETVALAVRLSGVEVRAIIFLLRKTYGFKKKEDELSMSQWGDGIQSDRSRAQRVVSTLLGMNIIYRRQTGPQSFVYGFNKYFATWDQTIFQPDSCRATRMQKSKPLSTQTTVVSPDNSTVVSPDNTTVVCTDKHNIQKHTSKDICGKNGTGPKTQVPDTEQQQFFGAICKCIGWDPATLTKEQKAQVGQAITVLRKASYTIDHLREFYRWWFAEDWRGKKGQHPTLTQLRAEIGKVKIKPDEPYAAEVYQ